MSARVAPDAREQAASFDRDESFEALAELMQATNPFLKNSAKLQAEYVQLCARRVCAYLEIPDRLSCCESPVDLLAEQRAFFATMQQDYAAAVQRLVRLQPLDLVTPAHSTRAEVPRPVEGETQAPDPTQKPTERKLSRRAA